MEEKFKNWIIFILLGLTLIFGYLQVTKDDSGYKSKIEKLREDNNRLIEENKKIDGIIDSLKVEYINLQKTDSLLNVEISKRDAEIAKALADSKKSKAELDRIKTEMEAIRKKIQELKANPFRRTDNELINSLKLKTQ